MAEERKESCKTINGTQLVLELIHSLLFADSSFLIHFPLEEVMWRRVVGRGGVEYKSIFTNSS